MTGTITIRLNAETKRRLEALAQRSKRSKSFLAAEAISQYVEAQEWQFSEIEEGLADLELCRTACHDKVSTWLKSWGKRPGRVAGTAST